MKLSRKLKWTLGLASMAALTALPMSVALVGCSKGDSGDSNDQDNNNQNGNNNNQNGNNLIVDENGIIQPLSKSDITPTQFNFDNSLNGDPIEVNSLEEANQMLEDKWNKLSNDEKMAYIKNDIQNWYNYTNLNCSGYSSVKVPGKPVNPDDSLCLNFTPPEESIPTFKNYDDPDFQNLKERGFGIANISSIAANNNNYNISISGSQIVQYLINGNAIVDSQMKLNQSSIISNINISYKLLQYQNTIFSGIIITPNSLSKQHISIDSCTNWKTNESTPINEYTKKRYNDTVGESASLNFNDIQIFPSPSLNMLFNIKK